MRERETERAQTDEGPKGIASWRGLKAFQVQRTAEADGRNSHGAGHLQDSCLHRDRNVNYLSKSISYVSVLYWCKWLNKVLVIIILLHTDSTFTIYDYFYSHFLTCPFKIPWWASQQRSPLTSSAEATGPAWEGARPQKPTHTGSALAAGPLGPSQRPPLPWAGGWYRKTHAEKVSPAHQGWSPGPGNFWLEHLLKQSPTRTGQGLCRGKGCLNRSSPSPEGSLGPSACTAWKRHISLSPQLGTDTRLWKKPRGPSCLFSQDLVEFLLTLVATLLCPCMLFREDPKCSPFLFLYILSFYQGAAKPVIRVGGDRKANHTFSSKDN